MRDDDLLLVKNVRISTDDATRSKDILIVDGRILDIAEAGALDPKFGRQLDGAGTLALPGLCNGHLHSHELLQRGLIWGLPLEPYILRNNPQLPLDESPTPDDVYVRTAVAAAEMLRGGTTLAADDVIHPPMGGEHVDAVMQAYVDSGIRANVSMMVQDLPWRQSIPFVDRLVPPELQHLLDQAGGSTETLLAFCSEKAREWSGRDDRVRLMMSPSAPQRSSPELLRGLWAISEEFDLVFHIHVQETLSQAVSGPLLFSGRTMLAYIDDLGLLDRRTNIAHAVWVTEDDIDRIARSGATVVHNPTSNLKLGSGVAPIRAMLDAGVNVALGCDGYTCNDAQDIIEAMKNASLISCIATTEHDRWLAPKEVLEMASANGYRANMREPARLKPGDLGDLVLVDTNSIPFAPMNDAVSQAVFSARARDVSTVIIDGQVVVEDKACTRLNESHLIGRLQEVADRYLSRRNANVNQNSLLMPYFEESYSKCVAMASQSESFRLIR